MKNTVIVTCVLAGAASLAAADSVNIVHNGHSGNLGQNVQIQLTGGLFFQDGGSNHNVWAGQISNTIDGVDAKTYCTELTQWAGSGVFDIVSVDNAPVPGNGMGQTKADAIYRLFNATNRGADIVDSSQAAAFQAVIWEIVYEFDGNESSVNIAAGKVRFTSGVNQGHFNTYSTFALDPQGDTTPTVVAAVNNDRQDQ
ncbi:MAG: hypothetical protein K8E66_05180, partial [Phycisphaerales bacterium]|nr:hypothetical protein [Phycisphaerales bacterium]